MTTIRSSAWGRRTQTTLVSLQIERHKQTHSTLQETSSVRNQESNRPLHRRNKSIKLHALALALCHTSPNVTELFRRPSQAIYVRSEEFHLQAM